MEKDDYYWLHYKINLLHYQFITLKWYCRNKLKEEQIFQIGGDLYDYRDGKTIKKLIIYYEGIESYERCEMLKAVLDGLEEYCY